MQAWPLDSALNEADAGSGLTRFSVFAGFTTLMTRLWYGLNSTIEYEPSQTTRLVRWEELR